MTLRLKWCELLPSGSSSEKYRVLQVWRKKKETEDLQLPNTYDLKLILASFSGS